MAHLTLSGLFDEKASLQQMNVPAGVKTWFIDMNGLTAINSMGIREFAAWARGLKADAVEFRNVPKAFVDQINNVAQFLPANSRIASFYVVYYNEDIDEEKMVLYTRDKEFRVNGGQVSFTHPTVKGDTGEEFALDVGEKYFRFLQQFG